MLAGLLVGSLAWAAEPDALPDAAMAVVARHKSVFDGPPQRTPSNASIDAPLLGNGSMLAALAGTGGAPEFWLTTNDFWLLKHGTGVGGPRPFGRLAIRFPGLEGASWKAEQDLATAVTTLRMEKDGAATTVRSWVAATENLLVVELMADGGPIAGQVELIPAGAVAVRNSGTARTVQLGREQYAGGRWYLDGLLDDVQVFDRALSADEVKSLAAGRRVAEGLIRHWAFDEPAGHVARDGAGQDAHGTIRGAERVEGARGRALKLDGRAGFVECPPMAVPRAFTITAGVRLSTRAPAGQAQYIFSMGEWNQGCSLGISQQWLRLAVGNDYAQSAIPVPLDRWVRLTGTFDGRQVRVYIAILTLGLLRNAFPLAIDMSRELDVDRECRQKWQHIVDHLSGYTTQQRGGKTVFRYTERGTDWWGNNTLGIQHIYPAGAIGLDSDPELLRLSRNTIEVMGRWRDGNGMNSFFPAAVRVGYDPEVILTQLRAMIEAIGQPNGFIRGNPHGIENCSIVPNTINEMMLLSHEGVPRLFRVWPRKRDARFANLRAYGAFLVSSELAGGEVQYVTLTSERGREAVVENPWPGHAVAATRNGKEAGTLSGERLVLKTSAGETITLTGVP